MALTGFGTVYFDDVRVEPFIFGKGKPTGDVSILPVGKSGSSR
jgi:hypothetical protein